MDSEARRREMIKHTGKFIGALAWRAIGFLFPALVVAFAIGVAVDIGGLFTTELPPQSGLFSWGIVWAAIMYWRWSLNRTEGYTQINDVPDTAAEYCKTIELGSHATCIRVQSPDTNICRRPKENDNG